MKFKAPIGAQKFFLFATIIRGYQPSVELRHLRYFVAVATETNFRKAADRLHVSQPALSKQIKLLEGELGVQLLDRHSAGARLSTSGRVFLDEAREILAHVERAVTNIRHAHRGASNVR